MSHDSVAKLSGQVLPKSTLGSGTPATAHILLVDDEPMVVGFMTEMLKLAGYLVSGFTQPLAALQAFALAPGVFDLVITDQNMPDVDGFELAAQIFDQRPNLPILMITGNSSLGRPKPGQAASIRANLTKPLPPPRLLQEVASALASGSPRLLPDPAGAR